MNGHYSRPPSPLPPRLPPQSVRQLLPRTVTRFDYGSDCTIRRGETILCNQIKYGSSEPPPYLMGTVKTPLMLVTGE